MPPQEEFDGVSIAIGLAACVVSSVFFGSMFVAVKKYDPGDGVFVQWVISSGIMVIGFIVSCVLSFPGFFPLAMLGGASWAIGNAAALPTMSRLGMTVAILIWNTTCCLTGWVGGRFGLFGMKANVPASQILNYSGLVFVIIGNKSSTVRSAQFRGSLFSMIKSETGERDRMTDSKADKSDNDTETTRLRSDETSIREDSIRELDEDHDKDATRKGNKGKQRIIGTIMALAIGIFYGMTFVPVIYMIDNPDKFPNYPDDGLAYAFSHYIGIFITATVIFIAYSVIKRGHPVIQPVIVLPSLLAGFLWGIAQTSFFIANQHLSQAVTFPIITMLPGCIVAAWSIFYFHEIKGSRNFKILAVAMLVTLPGTVMVGLSKFVEL